MVRLETKTHRYIGHSTDRKPQVGDNVLQSDGMTYYRITDADLPVGSSYLAEDTDEVSRWTGAGWSPLFKEDPQVALLQTISEQLASIRRVLEVGLDVEDPGE